MGIFNRLFAGRAGAASHGMTDAEAVKIINAYGKAIMDRKWQYGELSDLPYPKERIKQAIIHGIREGDDPKFREQLKAAYVTLADWQVGFGNGSRELNLTPEELRDPVKAAAKVLAMGDDFREAPRQVAEEGDLLLAELKALGL
jgi:hypothetical protein